MGTPIATMDFEVYSEAGFVWNGDGWFAPTGATKKGISAVGAVVYSEHPSTEVLCLAYDLKDSRGSRLWLPGPCQPDDLFAYLEAGGLVEAHNCSFEYWIWMNVCRRSYGWPGLNPLQLRDSMAKARAWALPGALGKASEIIGAAEQKGKEGTRLINLLCVPRKPTKNNPAIRIRPADVPEEADKLYTYCLQDIRAEESLSGMCPDLNPAEEETWQYTLLSNLRGMALDTETIKAGIVVLDQAQQKYNAELHAITGGAVSRGSEVAKLTMWIREQGVSVGSLDSDAIEELRSSHPLPPPIDRALEIRQLTGSAGVKKLYAMDRMVGRDGRAHDLLVYHAARTGRDGGQDIQAQNLAKAGPPLHWCGQCLKPYGQHRRTCPFCSCNVATKGEWSWQAVEHAVAVIRSQSVGEVERVYGDALLTISGCIRGLFVADSGKDLLCSDYSSIEAVVTAMLAGEEWRIVAFRRKEDIYLVSAGRITGRTLEEYIQHHEETGKKHPDRQKIGKPAELGLGFGGWVAAWRQFDKSDTFTEFQIRQNIMAWREASPMIVELWGGQVRGVPWDPVKNELFGLEGAAISAVAQPGEVCEYRMISYFTRGDALYCRLSSGRLLAYHRPRLGRSTRWEGQLELSFEGYNTNPKMGPIGWIRMQTYGGRLTENVVQATARDLMMSAVPNLERAGYPLVLRIHDELVAEVPEGTGSIEEMEHVMATTPTWATDWPIRASGGWRAKRYRKG